MKKYLFLLVITVFVLSVSCDKIKDATKVEFETELNFEIPIETTNKSALIEKSAAEIAAFPFGGDETFSLTDNDDISDYINNIDDIIVNGVSKVQIVNVPVDGKISACKLMYGINPNAGTVGFNITTELAPTNGTIEITDTAWINQLITLLKQNKKATFRLVVSGEASYDIQTVIKMKIPVKVEANPL